MNVRRVAVILALLCGAALPTAAGPAGQPAAGDVRIEPVARWTPARAWNWYRRQPWILGFNYVPSTAANTTEFWSGVTFDEATIVRELGWAHGLGFNACRVFIQFLVWRHDPAGLKERMRRFLDIAARHGLTVTPVLFDDCTFGDPPQTEPHLGTQRDPIPGMILPSWTPSPGLRAVEDRAAWPGLREYVRDLVGAFGSDRRVLFWDLYNEPGNSGMGNRSLPLVEAAFAWARSVAPSQPLTVGEWGAPEEITRRQTELSDIVSFHFYGPRAALRDQIAARKAHGRPVINTEWMARPLGSRWETDLPLFRREAVGAYAWGLVNGRTQCQFAWYDRRGTAQPAVWFHDLFHADGRPYDPAEHEAIRRAASLKRIRWADADYAKIQTAPGETAHAEDGIRFSDGWTRWTGAGPRRDRLHYAREQGATASWYCGAGSVVLIHKAGPDCGIARVFIDGRPAPALDTYSPTVEWNRRTVLALDLPPGRHTITVTVTGTHRDPSSDSYIQIVEHE